MNAFMLLMIWVLPLLLAVLAGLRYARWLMVLAPLPALVAGAVLPPGTSVSLPWLLLGAELGLDETGRIFLLFSALLWFVASLFAAGNPTSDRNDTRFRIFFLLAMAGNLGLILSQDMVSFYLGFTLMGLAAYGLIAHPASQHSREAARRYLLWTIAGELVLFVAIVLLASQNAGTLNFEVLKSNPPAGFIVLLLIAGFGIKLALPGLHFWLPQAYAVTPPAAVAVLSGAMIKAGLLGWLRFLPPGDAALIGWGQSLMLAGLTGIFFGAILGLLQSRPRLVLGYSSISKMGVLTSGMGAALAWPTAAPVLIGGLVIYAAHHALVKGALFLGLGLIERGGLRPWLIVGFAFLALALAGAPLTSGALAKSALTAGIPQQAYYLLYIFAASAFATTLVMARLLFLIVRQYSGVTSAHPMASVIAWLLLLTVIAAFPFVVSDASLFLTGAVPVSLGALLSALALLAGVRLGGRNTIGKRRSAGRRLARRLSRRIRSETHSTILVTGNYWRSAWHSLNELLRLTTRRRLTALQKLENRAYPWALAGSIWLGIAGLLLGGFVLAG